MEPLLYLGRWWIGAAGYRQKDSPQRDFYEQLPTSSQGLLPTDWDRERLEAELALQWRKDVKTLVREMIVQSVRTGAETVATVANHYIRAKVTNGDEIYLTLGAGGIYDPKVIAVVLDSVPGVSIGDWFIEPSVTLAIECSSGEVVWSTMLSEETLQQLIEEVGPS
ncbi:hypothetical protein HBE99_24075 [Mycobacteroides chelonae]|uniref:hypothetical protein n=1 Tax=Mycobacteroides chelonae TaxID=1774 RepID=UPI0019107694|nr:hypothetical protein [Mycobacteroides chelonae]QQG99543.1 hypothetical protein HBE99_24075 [Mycobacteroides chelonae]